MQSDIDQGVREFGASRLKLRGDLVFVPQNSCGQPYYLVEDPLNSRFFRLGLAEYTLVSLLDGETTMQAALSRLAAVMPHHQLSETGAAGLCRWLIEMDLAHTIESAQATRLAERSEGSAKRQLLAHCHPLTLRLPLCGPDAAFQGLARWCGWVFSPLFVPVWLLVLAYGGFCVASQWDRFVASSYGIFAAGNWLWMAACWILLKSVHEMAHGVVCKRYGGTVRELGVLFILLAPLAYVDVTSSWRFRSRRERIHVALAGMYIELLIASLAGVAWTYAGPGWFSNACYHVVVMASLSTILFNANPLMKFDGYYVLSDALGMPNLYVNGQTYIYNWARRNLLGVPAALPSWPRAQFQVVRVYGWAALCWRVVICVSLTVTAAAMFRGAGIVLAAIAVLLWLGLPAVRFVHYLLVGKPGEQPNRLRFCLTAGSAAALIAVVLVAIPWPGARSAPMIVEYAPHTALRAASAGFVRRIHVESGQTVASGQLLVELENHELARDLRDLELRIRQSEIRGRQHEQQGRLAARQAEEEERAGLLRQLDEKQAQVELLSIRAPRAGKVIRRDLRLLEGMFLEEGDEVLALGDESSKELRLSLAQADVDVFVQRVGQSVHVDVPRHPLTSCQLLEVVPRASSSPTHPALAAVYGGPLPVKPVKNSGDSSSAESYELLTPRFTAVVSLESAQSKRLRAGQRGSVHFRSLHESIGKHLYVTASTWLRDRMQSH